MESRFKEHPAAAIFPMLKGKAFEGMRDDIKEKGLLHPIVLAKHDGEWTILDGRNRERACLEAGRKPRYDYYDGEDPIGYVVSANLARREMTTWERASAADELAKLGKGKPKSALGADYVTQSAAAQECGTSTRSVQQAKQVKENAAPELIEALDAREISLRDAEQIAKLEREQQADAIEQRKRSEGQPRDPKISKACSLSDAELDGLAMLFKYGEGSPSERVRTGAAALARIVPTVRQ